MKKLSLDRNLLRRIGILFQILFPLKQSICPFTLQLALIVFLVSTLDQFTTYFIGVLPSEFYVALGNRDKDTFRFLIAKSAIIILSKALTLAACKYATSFLYLKCRQLCANTLHRLYYSNQVYYRLNVTSEQFDNPDQRMTQDTEKLTRILIQELFTPIIMAPFIVGYYTYLTYDSSGWIGPLTIYGYFASSTIVNKLILSPIVGLVNEQEQREGDLRAKHCEVRANIESIAFYRADNTENEITDQKLDVLIGVQKKLIAWRTFLSLATSIFDYFGGTLSYLLIAIPIFLTHDFDHLSATELSGIISKNVFFYLYLIYSFTRLVALAENFGDVAGVTHRVIGLYEELKRLNESSSRNNQKKDEDSLIHVIVDENEKSSQSRIGFITEQKRHSNDDNVSELNCLSDAEKESLLKNDDSSNELRPDDKMVMDLLSVCISKQGTSDSILVNELTMHISLDHNILITGDSSTGKTSILRVLADLWPCFLGSIERYSEFVPSNMLFIPQNPYFPSGSTTLRQQIVYPSKAKADEKEIPKLRNILEDIGMTHALKRCSGLDEPFDADWQETFSRGELQRLCIGRVLYHCPKIVFLDESTSALGYDMEMNLYKIIHERGISMVSVGHRQSLRQFHHVELHLTGDGGWWLRDIEKNLEI